MGRRRGRTGERDTTVIPSDPLLDLFEPEPLSPWVDPFEGVGLLSEIEDRRVFHPEAAARPPRLFSGGFAHVGTQAEVRGRSVKGASRFALRIGDARGDKERFGDVSHAVECAKRKSRREVIFASGKGGRRGRRQRPYRRGPLSSVSCK